MRGHDATGLESDEEYGGSKRVSDYDEATQTVLADDGERMSVFDLDDCPLCQKHLIHTSPHPTDPPSFRKVDQVLCMGCGFHAVRDAVVS